MRDAADDVGCCFFHYACSFIIVNDTTYEIKNSTDHKLYIANESTIISICSSLYLKDEENGCCFTLYSLNVLYDSELQESMND